MVVSEVVLIMVVVIVQCFVREVETYLWRVVGV